MDKEIINFILGLFLIILISGLIVFAVIDNNKFIYECTDTQGNVVYCIFISAREGGLFGKTEDGTYMQITSYKRIRKEERKFGE